MKNYSDRLAEFAREKHDEYLEFARLYLGDFLAAVKEYLRLRELLAQLTTAEISISNSERLFPVA
jgi:hypothetical protein